MSETLPSEENGIKSAVISILLLSAAAFGFLLWILYFRPTSETTNPEALSFLPAMNAALNSLCAVCVLSGVAAIKLGYRRVHISLMVTAIALSAVFLISYITYHSVHGDTKFVTEGAIRYAYFGLLISHVLCTAFALPLIISAVFFAVTKRLTLHKKVVKFTVPLWLYVSVTGVTIYFLLKANS